MPQTFSTETLAYFVQGINANVPPQPEMLRILSYLLRGRDFPDPPSLDFWDECRVHIHAQRRFLSRVNLAYFRLRREKVVDLEEWIEAHTHVVQLTVDLEPFPLTTLDILFEDYAPVPLLPKPPPRPVLKLVSLS